MELMMKQKRCKIDGISPRLITHNDKGDIEVVKTVKSSNFLGGMIQENIQWQEHLETGEDPLPTSLRKKLGLLKFLGKHMPRKCKLLLVNGLLISKILYLLLIYGGTQAKYLKKLQIILNDAAQFITGFGRRCNKLTLMEAVAWLDIVELTEMHTLNLTWRILRSRQPRNLADKFEMSPDNEIMTNIPRIQNTMMFLKKCQERNSQEKTPEN